MESKDRRRLAAIMFTDIVGYSALTQRNEALSMQLLQEHFALLRPIFPGFEGIEIKTIGDAFLVRFPSALQAVGCAIEIQKRLWERNRGVPDDKRIVIRIGLHLGDVIDSGGDVFGDGVNIAARIEPCAPAGGVCISEDVARAIRNKVEYPLLDLGYKQFKNIAEPSRVFAVQLPWLAPEVFAAAAEKLRVEPPLPGVRRPTQTIAPRETARGRLSHRLAFAAVAGLVVAVSAILFWPEAKGSSDRLALLPLEYHGPPERSATAKMLPALLVESLRDSPQLVVTPFDSSRHVAAGTTPLEAARELDVDWVLRGQLEIVSSRYGVVFNLLDRNGRNLWERRKDGEAEQIFNVAEELTGEIQSALGVPGHGAFHAMSRSRDAVRSYLEGKALLEGWDVESNFQKAREDFEKATSLDPGFGEAFAGLALAIWGSYEESGDAKLVAVANDAAKSAVALAPDYPEAHLAQGVIQLGRGLSQEAVLSFKQALDRAPANDAVCRRIGDAYKSLGRDSDAEEMYQRAIDLKPDFWQNYRAKGNFYLARGRFHEAKELFRKVVDLRPESDVGHNNLGLAYLGLGQMAEAEQELRAALKIQRNMAGLVNLGFIRYSAHDYQEAADLFEQATAISNDYRPWVNLGDARRQLHQTAEASKAYEKAIELTQEWLRVNPGDATVRAAMAYSLAGVHRCEAAGREAAAAVAGSGDDNPVTHYYAAVAYGLCGRDTLAADEIESAIKGGWLADVETNPDLRRFLERPGIRSLIDSRRRPPDPPK